MVNLDNDVNLSIKCGFKIGEEYINRSLISYHSDQNDSFSFMMSISLNIKIEGN